jgi:hypothetical protein
VNAAFIAGSPVGTHHGLALIGAAPTGPTDMNTDLKAFVTTVLRVVLATMFVVMTIAFVSVPMELRGHPGEPVATASADRHMT